MIVAQLVQRASDTRDSPFESQHRLIIYLSIERYRKVKNKEKEAGIGQFKKVCKALSALGHCESHSRAMGTGVSVNNQSSMFFL